MVCSDEFSCVQELSVTNQRLYDLLDHFTSYSQLPVAPILYVAIVILVLLFILLSLITYLVINRIKHIGISESRLAFSAAQDL